MISRIPKETHALFRSEVASDRDRSVRMQYGILAYRLDAQLAFELLLVRSRAVKGWIIPAGWPIKGLGAARSAAREGYEEAGILGTVGSKSVGVFSYRVALEEGRGSVPCEVCVFPMLVTRQLSTWPESHDRVSRWVSLDEARALLKIKELYKLVTLFAEQTMLFEKNKMAEADSNCNISNSMTFKDAARKLDVTVRTMRRWVAAGKMPPRIKDGREKKFLIEDIEMKAAEVTIEEAAELTGVTVRTLRRWLAAGKMPTRTTTGRRMKFRRADIEALIRQGEPSSRE